MPGTFLDTNVLLRHLTRDHLEHSPRATAYLKRVESGEIQVRIADTVVFETVFTLERFYQQSRDRIRDALLPLLELPGVILPGKRHYPEVFAVYIEQNLSFADAYHVVLAKSLKLDQFASFDRGIDRVPGIRRVEP